MTLARRRAATMSAPDPPELPEAVRPPWPPWHAPAALFGAFGATAAAALPLLPVLLVFGISDELAGIALLALLLVQDGLLLLAAFLLAASKRAPRPWHFGIRATRLWPTVGWAALAFAVLLGFELGYIELLGVDESNVEDFGGEGVVSGVAVAVGVIVVAPVAEELFFRAFFYRALRTRLRVWSAALIDGIVFGALHFQGIDTAIVLPVIALVGVGLCLVYERTGSVFAVIAIHAAFNAVAMVAVEPVAAVTIGATMLVLCLVTPSFAGRRPSPVPT